MYGVTIKPMVQPIPNLDVSFKTIIDRDPEKTSITFYALKKEYEKKRLVVNWNNQGYEFEVQPEEINDKIIYNINLFDGRERTIERKNGEWWMLSGNQIYTDLLISYGAMIEHHYPELF